MTESSLCNLFTGVLMNCRGFLSSWGEYVLSAAAWLQVSLLCDHVKHIAVRACLKVMQRFLSYTGCTVRCA